MRIEQKPLAQRLISAGLAKEMDRIEVERFRSIVQQRVVAPMLARRARQFELIDAARRWVIL
jgi:hypothetical protein